MTKSNLLTKSFTRVFALDLRSLAIFRIALGVLIIADLILRWPSLVDMYTEEGLFTRELSFEFYDQNYASNWPQTFWSVYWLSDSPIFVYALFGIAFVSAVFMVVGKWTRVATIISWILLASIQVRNPLVTSSGDFMFKMMLFWSMFLPLGAKWSFDNTSHSNDEDGSICSFASVGYIFQLFAMYFFSGLAKWNSVWLNGDAMDFVLRLDIYARNFGKHLLDYPEILSLTSWATLFAEIILIWMLFSCWRNSMWRLINLAIFWLFHIGIALSMAIGLFPWICMVAWLPLIPKLAWQIRSSDSNTNTTNRFKWAELSTFQLAIEMFCLFVLFVVISWNVSNLRMTDLKKDNTSTLLRQIGTQMSIDQYFKMFGEPPAQNPWFVYEGQLPDGSKIDLWRNAKIDIGRPESGLAHFPSFHWRKFHRNSLAVSNQFVRQSMLDYVVKRWNHDNPDRQVVKARLICFVEPIGPSYKNGNFTSGVWAQYNNRANEPGSLFESFLQEEEDLSL